MRENSRYLKDNHSPVVMKPQRAVTCEGRFPELRTLLGDFFGKKEPLSLQRLEEVFELVKDELYTFDTSDNYFSTSGDDLRLPPREQPASLVPLLARKADVPSDIFDAYIASVDPNTDKKTVRHLQTYNKRTDLSDRLRAGENFSSRYITRTNFGIGIRQNEAVASDSPFNIEIWHRPEDKKSAPQHALTVGFWYRKMGKANVMVVDQLQEARTDYGKLEKLGELGLKVACDVGQVTGMDQIWVYPAQKHPMFKRHPERGKSALHDFEQIYDESAMTLKFSGDKSTFYIKDIKR